VKQARGFDWDAARRRLEAAQSAIESGAVLQAAEIERAYRERARFYAQPSTEQERQKTDRVLLFQVGASRFGLPAGDVVEVIARPKITPVPGAPPIIAGLIQVRGEIRPVVNLTAALGLPAPEGQHPAGLIILLRGTGRILGIAAGRVFGIAADRVDEIVTLNPEDRKQAAPGELPGSWLTADFTTVLETRSLIDKIQDPTPL
jgi:purine-binding chemotaxis protein CheW